jgi:hypothetical protein
MDRAKRLRSAQFPCRVLIVEQSHFFSDRILPAMLKTFGRVTGLMSIGI